MKKVIVTFVFLICAVFLFAGCGEKSMEEKVAEAISEEITDVEMDITDDDGNVIIETENGSVELESGENLQWPEGKTGDLPELAGNIVFVSVDDNGGATISLENVEKSDAESYFEQIIALGYIGTNMTDETEVFFSGRIDEKNEVTFNYNFETKEALIIFLDVE